VLVCFVGSLKEDVFPEAILPGTVVLEMEEENLGVWLSLADIMDQEDKDERILSTSLMIFWCILLLFASLAFLAADAEGLKLLMGAVLRLENNCRYA